MSSFIPSAPEILVNTATAGSQSPSYVTALTGGATVAAWLDAGSGALIGKFRLFAADGAAASAEINIGPAYAVQTAALTNGGFAIVWIETTAGESTVHSQLYDAAGAVAGPRVDLGAYAEAGPVRGEHPLGLHAVGLSDGGFAAAWSVQTSDLMGFHGVATVLALAGADGAVEATYAQQVGTASKTVVLYDPAVNLLELPDAKLMLTWGLSASAGGGLGGQHARLFDLSGAAVSSDLQLDSPIPSDGGPVIDSSAGISTALMPDGRVAFAWVAFGKAWVSLYPSANLGMGNLTGRTSPQQVGELDGPGAPQVLALTGGGFLVAWSGGGEGGTDPLARIFTADGLPEGPAFRLGDVAAGLQDSVLVAPRANGGLLAIWRDDSHLAAPGQQADDSGTAVKAQVLAPDPIHHLTGGEGADSLAGGPGEDWLMGLGGADTLWGGPDADKFILTEGGGQDRILDFQSGVDLLLMLDGQGRIPTLGLLSLNPATHELSWDADGNAGSAPAEAIATLAGVVHLGRSDLAAGFQPRAVRILQLDGGYERTVFDWGTEAFDTAVGRFTATGVLRSYTTNLDDGSQWTTWLDHAASQPWASRTADYDASGAMVDYGVTYDDGRRVVFTFDPRSQEIWQRIVEETDAAGRLTARAAVYDDGSRYEAVFDAAGDKPWASIVDTYDASAACWATGPSSTMAR
ncbi:hypothetical protein [uncultured Phenylobacterium sp.]|uniref:hypothetical protein n=1 Tax=uncultured Phenylobacterium sp. TaxID=349273 RepID=UPI0025CD2ABB|nr:hypothetical protein [uncultured Phenylobacterium sp.]